MSETPRTIPDTVAEWHETIPTCLPDVLFVAAQTGGAAGDSDEGNPS
jgi:hypothetical protein